MEGRQRRSFTEDENAKPWSWYCRPSIDGVGRQELGLRDSVLRRWVDRLRQEPAGIGAEMHHLVP